MANRRNVKSETVDVLDPERPKDFLTEPEFARLLKGAGGNRHNLRDVALFRMIFDHGLRVSEATGLRRSSADLDAHRLHFKRLKNGFSVPHPMQGETVRAVKRYLASREDAAPWLFVSERGTKMTRQAVNYLIATAGTRAKLGHVHPHMLRHACGYALEDRGTDFRVMQDFLGHKDPRHTAHYTRTSPRRFDRVWERKN
ncbi:MULTISPECIES: tyrosine-type recombinase/integrase [unclassified Methylobacterium]|uniref:tyrosine-type recombinase/integrase n=1 Tax=unclassified Methylobacterium TaxID=2615210 RepID=UPI00226AE376|nr:MULTISPECIES: tyrosine-type recombinase/integrase [unclassified Methylobacterium]